MALDDMPRIDVDPRLAERLIDGRASGADLPRGVAGAARVLEAARRAATERDDTAMASTVAAMRGVLAPNGGEGAAAARPRLRIPSPLPRILTAGAAGLAVLFGGLAAAGALPAGAQRPVADLVSHVGIDLPQPSAGDKTTPKATETTTTTSTTSTTVATADTTPTTAPTTETTVTAPPCSPPAYAGPNGCVTPLPVPEPTTVPPPTTTTTVAPHPTTTVPPPTTTTVASGAGHARVDG
jgi:hypothetical protein